MGEKYGGEIISADSVQVYRGLDIGSAKPTVEQRRRIPHHLIDILDPDQEYSASAFRQQADEIIQRLSRSGTPIFLAGGTGFYLKVLSRGIFRGPGGSEKLRSALRRKAEKEGEDALHRELLRRDPDAGSRIHPRDTFRLIRALEVCLLAKKPISQLQREHGFRESHYRVLKIGLQDERDELYRRIEGRVDEMMDKGWLEEVRSLLGKGYSPGLKSMRALGYKRLVSHLTEGVELGKALHLIKQDTRRYAKRQITWFKADRDIHWFSARTENYPSIHEKISDFFHHC